MFILLKAVGILPSCLQVSDPMVASVELCDLWVSPRAQERPCEQQCTHQLLAPFSNLGARWEVTASSS